MSKFGYFFLSLIFLVMSAFGMTNLVNFSGVLKGESGAINGVFPVQIQMLDGNNRVIWQEQYPQVTFSNGSFTLVLGSVNANGVDTDMVRRSEKMRVIVGSNSVDMGFSSVMYTLLSNQSLGSDRAMVADQALVAESANSVRWEDIVGKPTVVTRNVTYSAGNGLELSGTTFSLSSLGARRGEVLKWDGSNWVASADINTRLTAGIIQREMLASGVIGSGQLAAGAVTSEKLGSGAVTSEKLATGSVMGAKIGDGEISGSKIATGSITNREISASAGIAFSKLRISKADIVGLGIPSQDTRYSAGTGLELNGTTFSLKPEIVTSNYHGTVKATYFEGDGSLLQNVRVVTAGSIGTDKLQEGAITSGKIATGAVTTEKIAEGAITSAKIATGAVTTVKLANQAVTTEKLGWGAVTSEKIATGAITSAKILDGTITNADVSPTAALSFSKLAISKADIVGLGIPSQDTRYSGGTGITLNGTTFSVKPEVVTSNYHGTVRASKFVGDGSGLTNLPWIVQSGITSEKIENGAITSAKIATGAITTDKLGSGVITSIKIGEGAITSSKIGNAAITTSKLSDRSVTSSKIATGAITTVKLADQAITTSKIATGAITSEKILDGTIVNGDVSTTAGISFSKLSISKRDIVGLGIPTQDTTYSASTGLILTGTTFSINADVVTSNYHGTIRATGFVGDGSQLTGVGGIVDGAVTTAKIATGAITTEKIAEGAITTAKLATGSISTEKIATESITTAKLAEGAITPEKIATGSITTAKLAEGAVTSEKILDGTITNRNVSPTAGISFSKLNISKADIVGLGIPGAAVIYRAGTGITLNGTVFSVKNEVVTSNYHGTITAVAFEGDGSRLTGLLGVTDGVVTSSKIATGAVTTVKVAAGAITTGKIATSAITTAKLATGSITTEKIGTHAITTAKIATGAITAAKIATGAVTTAKIQDGTITNEDVSPTAALSFSKLAITKADIVGLGIPTQDTKYSAGTGLSLNGTTFSIKSDVVTSNYHGTITATGFVGDGSQITGIGNLVDGVVTEAKIAPNAITTEKLAAGAVTTAKIATGAITAEKIATYAITTAKIATGAITAEKIATGAITTAKIANGTITNADISASAGISFSKLAITKADIVGIGIPTQDTTYNAGTGLSLNGTTFSINASVVTSNYHGTITASGFVGDGSQLTGISDIADNAITSSKIATGAVTTGKIATAAITTAKIATAAITTGKIATGAITTAKIATGAITAAKIATGAVTTAKIQDGTITNADVSPTAALSFSKLAITKADIVGLGIPTQDTTYNAGTGLSLNGTTFSINASVVTSNYHGTIRATGFVGDGSQLINLPGLVEGEVTEGKIATGAITTAKIATGAITTEKIGTGAITAAKIATGAITTAKIATGAVTAEKIATGAVTTAKIANGTITNADVSASAGISFSKLAITKADIVGLGIPTQDTTYGAGTGLTLNGTTFLIKPEVVTSNYHGTITADAFVGDGSQLTGIPTTNATTLSGLTASAFLRTNGSVGLSGDWNAGSHEVRARTFYSDVATGTAPIKVDSTTKVTNLNADTLDGVDSTGLLQASNNLSELTATAATVRTNLNLIPGSNIQTYSAALGSLAATSLSNSSSEMFYTDSQDHFTKYSYITGSGYIQNMSAATNVTEMKQALGFIYPITLSSVHAEQSSYAAIADFNNSGGSDIIPTMRMEFNGLGGGTLSSVNNFMIFGDASNYQYGSIGGNDAGGTRYSYLDFSSEDAKHVVKGGGIKFESTGADYAEYLPKQDVNEDFLPGDIVGVFHHHISKKTKDADRLMVVSLKPVVIGNSPLTASANHYELVAFLGQLYVKVKGPVRSGEYIVASGDQDGSGIAKNRAVLGASDRVVGQAWETNSYTGLKLVKIAIRPLDFPYRVLGKIAKIERGIERIKQQNTALRTKLGLEKAGGTYAK